MNLVGLQERVVKMGKILAILVCSVLCAGCDMGKPSAYRLVPGYQPVMSQAVTYRVGVEGAPASLGAQVFVGIPNGMTATSLELVGPYDLAIYQQILPDRVEYAAGIYSIEPRPAGSFPICLIHASATVPPPATLPLVAGTNGAISMLSDSAGEASFPVFRADLETDR